MRGTPASRLLRDMRVIGRTEVEHVLEFPALIDAVREVFATEATAPRRSLHALAEDMRDALGVQTAWTSDTIALKTFTWLPENPAHGRDTVAAVVLLFDRRTGEPLAVIEGSSITLWRTAAVSALAADYLARRDARTLLVCGTGALAPYMARAHAAVRPIERVLVWGRNRQHAERTAAHIADARPELQCDVVAHVADGAAEADVITCATAALDPFLFGADVRPGTHVDLVGNHDARGRECDTELVVRSRVYVDTRVNVLSEAGELLIPIAEGVFSADDVVAELSELCRGTARGRTGPAEVTLFKSVGTALSDLAAARLVVRSGAGKLR